MKFLIPVVYFIFPQEKLIYFLITFTYFLIFLCYVKCQNILVNTLVHLLEPLSFWLIHRSFLLLKFTLQLKLMQYVMRVRILAVGVTSSILRILLSGFWFSGFHLPSPKVPVPGSRVLGSEFHLPGIQESQRLGSKVLISGHAWFRKYCKNNSLFDLNFPTPKKILSSVIGNVF